MESELTDEALVAKFRETKDMNIFKSLVRRYQNRIFNVSVRMLGNVEEAEEVVQDTFLKMHQSLDKFRNQSTFAAWLFRIAYNLCVDAMRSRRRKGITMIPITTQSSMNEETETESPYHQIKDDRPDPAEKLDNWERTKLVLDSLDQLPENQKSVLVLADMEGFSYQEISEIVGANVGTVRSRVHYGRLKLKELLEPYFASKNMPLTSR
jgi:RNA polymerase sigma factor, sigma-70 family